MHRPQMLAGAVHNILPTLEHELSFVFPCKQAYPRDAQQLAVAVAAYKAATKLLLGDTLQDSDSVESWPGVHHAKKP